MLLTLLPAAVAILLLFFGGLFVSSFDFLRSYFRALFLRRSFIFCARVLFTLRCLFDGQNRGTNDVHCALLASGQCIGNGFLPFS